IGETTINLGIALCIDWCLRNAGSRIGRALEWRPLAWVGLLSYSLYLWQQPFLNRHSDAPVTTFPLSLALAVAAALASYYLVERPALRLRARLQARFARWLTRPKPALERAELTADPDG